MPSCKQINKRAAALTENEKNPRRSKRIAEAEKLKKKKEAEAMGTPKRRRPKQSSN
jgi:hypothetical protein